MRCAPGAGLAPLLVRQSVCTELQLHSFMHLPPAPTCSFNAGQPIREDVNPTGRRLFEREQVRLGLGKDGIRNVL